MFHPNDDENKLKNNCALTIWLAIVGLLFQSPLSATLTEILFEEGQEVKAGDVLVKLDNLEQVADLAAAKAALVDTEASFNRSTELFRTNVVAKSQLLQDEARKIADEAMVSVAQKRLADTIVRAPFAGRIGLRRVSLGSLLGPGTVITTLHFQHLLSIVRV